MNVNKKYDFREAELEANFAKENFKKVKALIDSGFSFNTLAMPGVGVSYFLRFLATRDFAYFIHVDLYSLSELSKKEFFRLFLNQLGGSVEEKSDQEVLLECQRILNELAVKYPKVVVIFNRFDQLQKEFDKSFFANIRSLRNLNPEKIIMIFTSNKPLYEIASDAIVGANLNFYSKFLYFKPYSREDLKELLSIAPTSKRSPGEIEKLADLSGGHAQLFSILMNSEKQGNLLLDHFVKMQMKELLDFLSFHQKKIVTNIALGKKVAEMDDYLVGVGMVKKVGEKYQLFTLLLSEYIVSHLPIKLPVKERKLFRLLRQNFGKMVTKEEIFKEVWEDDLDKATDWALDALIYRLRKNPTFSSQGYIIESQKKQGYILYQS